MNISLHGSIYVCNTFFRSLPMPCWWSSCYSRSLLSRTRVFLVPSPSISNYFQSNQRAEKLGSDFEGFKISSLQSLRYVSISSSLSFFSVDFDFSFSLHFSPERSWDARGYIDINGAGGASVFEEAELQVPKTRSRSLLPNSWTLRPSRPRKVCISVCTLFRSVIDSLSLLFIFHCLIRFSTAPRCGFIFCVGHPFGNWLNSNPDFVSFFLFVLNFCCSKQMRINYKVSAYFYDSSMSLLYMLLVFFFFFVWKIR